VNETLESSVADTPGSMAQARRAVVALGSNLGNRFAALQAALDALAGTAGIRVTAASPVYETAPIGGPADAPEFLNAVVTVDTTLPAMLLLDRLHALEEQLGRKRGAPGDPRTLDLDILDFAGFRSTSSELTLPHPRAHRRAFVLQPWLDIDPAAQPGRIGTTSRTALLALAVVGFALGWVLAPVLGELRGVVPSVPWSAVLALAFIAALLFGTAWLTYRTIHRRRELMDPQRAVNLLVLAKASALAGALVAGGYLGFGVHFLDSLDIPLPQQRVIRSGLAAIGAVLVCVGGLLLERALRIPRGPDEDANGDPG
jgi:2-amino-4-hydroxy-6-hydroxymethyldihydropteridine diphosphokinase